MKILKKNLLLKNRNLFFIFFIILGGYGSVWATVPYHSFTLSNGLRVIYIPRIHSALAYVQVMYFVGELDSPKTQSGLAHLVEHLLERSQSKKSKKSLTQFVRQIGGNVNAYTTMGRSVYYEMFQSIFLYKVLRYEANRMAILSSNPQIFSEEKKGLLQEIHSYSPATLQELITNTALRRVYHGLTRFPLGTVSGIHHISFKKAHNFFSRWYQPNNAVMVIIGNFSFSKIKSRVKNEFGSIPSHPVPKHTTFPLAHFSSNQHYTYHISYLYHPVYLRLYPISVTMGSPTYFAYMQLITHILEYAGYGFIHYPLNNEDMRVLLIHEARMPYFFMVSAQSNIRGMNTYMRYKAQHGFTKSELTIAKAHILNEFTLTRDNLNKFVLYINSWSGSDFSMDYLNTVHTVIQQVDVQSINVFFQKHIVNTPYIEVNFSNK